MNRERILQMATFLEKEVPKSKFDINYWHNGKDRGKLKEMGHACGTVACAMGWAADQGLFGLELTRNNDVKYGPHEGGFLAAVKLFDLTHNQASKLFSGAGYITMYPTPCDVAAKIRKLVIDDEAQEASANAQG